MEKFEASNGVEITSDGARVTFKCTGTGEMYPNGHQLTPAETNALREFFQAERDQELGRWRFPENTDYVVYPNPDEAFERMFGPNLDLIVLRESDGMTKGYVRAEDRGGEPMAHRTGHILAARAYFDAHPEPKTWEDAKPGEVWEITRDGIGRAVYLRATYQWRALWPFSGSTSPASSLDRVTDARRIYPESD